MELSGTQMEAFNVALRDAYRTRADLKIFLRYKLDKHLDDSTGNEGLEIVVMELLEKAEAEGWLEELYVKAREHKPRNPSLRRLGRELALSSSSARQSGYELLDSSNFDLRDFEDAFWRVRYDAGGIGGVLGFLVRNMEDILLDNLRKRLERALDPAEHKPTLTLSPEFNSLERPLRILSRYKQDLADRNVLCIVRVDGEVTTLNQFWGALIDEFRKLERFLVLIFAGTGSTAGPAGITELPPPRFEPYEIAKWTSDVSRHLLGWSQVEANAWSDLILVKSLDEQQKLDPYYLYDTLDTAIRAIRADQDAYCRMLRERSQGAISTSH